MRSLVVVSAGLSNPSSTRLLADQLADATDRALRLRGEDTEVVRIELRDLAHAITDNLLTGFPSGELADAVAAVARADALIAVTPVFSASYSGLFKTFFDVLDRGVLDARPTLLGATAGTARHSLVVDQAMRPLFAYLRADVVATGVFAATEDFGAPDGVRPRVERAARELADKVLGRPAQRTSDPFEKTVSFEDLLRG